MIDNFQTWLLLGREQYAQDWAGSLRWSECGGACKSGEEDPAVTAGREFFEETLGVLGDPTDKLQERHYCFRLTIRRKSSKSQTMKTLFAVRAPWNPEIIQEFHGRREHLRQILNTVARIREIQRQLAQDRWPVPDYMSRIDERLRLITSLTSIEQHHDDQYRVWLRVCEVPKTPDEPPEPEEPISVDVPENVARQYMDMLSLWNELERCIGAFPAEVAHRAIVRRELRKGTQAWLPYIKRDFLEKDELRLWSLPELVEALAHPKGGPLRHSFVTPLRIFLRQLAKGEADLSASGII